MSAVNGIILYQNVLTRAIPQAFLAGTQVWVCSVCGFVYIGGTPPAICPVCKVPAWKFDKIEGRRPA